MANDSNHVVIDWLDGKTQIEGSVLIERRGGPGCIENAGDDAKDGSVGIGAGSHEGKNE